MAQNDFSEALEHLAKFMACMTLCGGSQSATVTMQPAALDIEDAAKYLGISRSKLYELKDAGKIKPPRDNEGKKVYLRKDLDAYLKNLKE
jgi:excisionase family DNA binding protein